MSAVADLPEDPAQFLRRCPPFDRLAADAFARVEGALELIYAPAGTALLVRGGAPSRYLYVVRKGTLRLEREGRLVELLEEGEPFGFVSLLGSGTPEFDVLAAEDCLLVRLPADVFHELLREPDVADFFLSGLADRLRRSSRLDTAPGAATDLVLPLRQLVARLPARIGSSASVGDAALLMRRERVSSVLVDDRPLGILTDRDLRARVLAEGRGPETPVAEVMTAPVKTLGAEAPLMEGLLFMLEEGVHHVPLVTNDGDVVGVLTDTDLLRHQAKSPLYLLKALEREGPAGEPGGFARELLGMVETLAWSGLGPIRIGRVVSTLVDALVRRLLREAEARLGLPPCAYAWVALGSEGRREQILPTDQDNALVVEEPCPGSEAYFEELARIVVEGLLEAGFPECPGGYMATRWRDSLSGWQSRVRIWVATPRPEAILDLSTVLDLRPVAGELNLAPLEETLVATGEDRSFLRALAHGCLTLEPPLGIFRHLRESDEGIDVKRGGILAIVTLARLFAVEGGVRARGTLERLAAAAHAGVLTAGEADGLSEGFRFLLRLRLMHQLKSIKAGEKPGNRVSGDALRPADRRALREIFALIRDIQQAVAHRYATNLLG